MTDKTDYYVEYHLLKKRTFIRSMIFIGLMIVCVVRFWQNDIEINKLEAKIYQDDGLMTAVRHSIANFMEEDSKLQADCHELNDAPLPTPHEPGER